MRLPGFPRRPRSDSRGQSLVEFALLAPIMIFLLFAILDLARIYTAMASVESAAREAADYGTAQGAARWSAGSVSTTVDEMQRRACTAASDLHDFDWTDTNANGVVDTGEPCTNPSFDWCVSESPGSSCVKTYHMDDPLDPAVDTNACDYADREPPCTVTVTMRDTFHLFVPLHIDFFGVTLGLPATLAFERDSTFAVTDIDAPVSPSP